MESKESKEQSSASSLFKGFLQCVLGLFIGAVVAGGVGYYKYESRKKEDERLWHEMREANKEKWKNMTEKERQEAKKKSAQALDKMLDKIKQRAVQRSKMTEKERQEADKKEWENMTEEQRKRKKWMDDFFKQ